MPNLGFPELIIILLILVTLVFLLVVPIVGITRAFRRMKEKRRSTGGVVWPVVNLTIMGGIGVYVLASGGSVTVLSVVLIALNAAWLFSSLSANRLAGAAARSKAAG